MRGIITSLRDIVPIRALTITESLDVAERQANMLLAMTSTGGPPTPEKVIADLPRIEVERLSPSPVSGAVQWTRGRWLVVLNGAEPKGRQRFSLAHEFKHVLDNPFIDVLYPSVCTMTSELRAERVCDHFAACLLMPREWLVRECAELGVDVGRLARRFEVSNTAMHVRLASLGLADRRARRYHIKRKDIRHEGTTHERGRYKRIFIGA